MKEFKDYSEEINKKIEQIQMKINSGELTLLDVELVPIFEHLKNSLHIENLNHYTATYNNALQLLVQKFEELEILINNIDRKDGFLSFLKSNSRDIEIEQLLSDCWIKPFNIDSLSFDYLEISKEKLNNLRREPIRIEHLDKLEVGETFLLEIPKGKFTEKMLMFYKNIKNKLPCAFDEIFENEQNQITIYENFVYLLHLLQLGKIKYQKESNFLYLK